MCAATWTAANDTSHAVNTGLKDAAEDQLWKQLLLQHPKHAAVCWKAILYVGFKEHAAVGCNAILYLFFKHAAPCCTVLRYAALCCIAILYPFFKHAARCCNANLYLVLKHAVLCCTMMRHNSVPVCHTMLWYAALQNGTCFC